MSTEWLDSRKLTKGQRVKARICNFRDRERHNTLIEGTIIEDTDGMFEVFKIHDDAGNAVMVFYPEEVLT